MEIYIKYETTHSKKDQFQWTLFKDIHLILSDKTHIMIPAGFVTDFASVPRFLWSFVPPIGKFNLAALVHDYCYVTQYRAGYIGMKKAKQFADKEFYYWMRVLCPEKKIRNYVMYICVKWFGNKRYRNKGEK